jgi:hypothetical protein
VPRRLKAGDNATPEDLHLAQSRERFQRAELERIRNAALAWRNGLAGLLAAITGFGLIKGRSDITALSPFWSRIAGILLAIALAVGILGALALLKAAHGLPAVRSATGLGRWVTAEHREAMAAARSLRQGIVGALACAVVLVIAVGVTWYGPARDTGSYLRVATRSGSWCGRSVSLTGSKLRLEAPRGPVVLLVSDVLSITPAGTCG